MTQPVHLFPKNICQKRNSAPNWVDDGPTGFASIYQKKTTLMVGFRRFTARDPMGKESLVSGWISMLISLEHLP